jgi:hypothetical protein
VWCSSQILSLLMGCKVTQLPALLDKQASYRKVVVLVDHKLVKVFSSLKCNFFESVDDLYLPAPTAFCIICHCEMNSHSAIFGTGFSVTILLWCCAVSICQRIIVRVVVMVDWLSRLFLPCFFHLGSCLCLWWVQFQLIMILHIPLFHLGFGVLSKWQYYRDVLCGFFSMLVLVYKLAPVRTLVSRTLRSWYDLRQYQTCARTSLIRTQGNTSPGPILYQFQYQDCTMYFIPANR